MPRRPDAQDRVTKALDALDSILSIARGGAAYYRQQTTMMKKAIKQFESAIDGLFSPDEIAEVEQSIAQETAQDGEPATSVRTKGRGGCS